MISLSPSVYMATVLGLGILAQWLAWRFRQPAIVLLLFFGLVVGAVFGPPDDYLGVLVDSGGQAIDRSILFPLVSLAVGVILFEGGLSLRFREIRDTGGVVLRLVSIGLAITAVLTTIAAHFLLDLGWEVSMVLGALLTVSGPTVILPILRHVRPSQQLASLIKWEGIVNDPIGAVLAALVLEIVLQQSSEHALTESLQSLLLASTIGIGGGIAVGAFMAWLFRSYLVPDYLQNSVSLALVLMSFAGSNALQSEAGLITVTILGIYLANQRQVAIRHLVEFKENLRVLLISVLFVVLASRADLRWDFLRESGWGCLVFVAVLILVIRPLSVYVATAFTDLQRNERLLLAWMHPRGIVAFAVSTLFALELRRSQPDMAEDAEKLATVTLLVVIGTVTVYGLSLGRLARSLGLSRQNPQGLLIAGATAPVREIALAIQQEGFAVLLVDTNSQNIAAARVQGLPVCFASISSETVQEEADLGDIGQMLAMTPNDEVNTLGTTEHVEMFGRACVYQLAPSERYSQRHERIPARLRARILFAKPMTYQELETRYEAGARIKTTTLSDDFTLADYRRQYGERAAPLFALQDRGNRLRVLATDSTGEPKKGDRLIALVTPESASSTTA